MTPDGGLSDAARAYAAALVPNHERTDFDRIDEIRAESRAGYEAASVRAIARHDLELTETTVGGIDCTRVVSARAGTAAGTLLYVFGGAFIEGDPFCDLPVIGALAEWCRVEVIAPHYRLAPEHPAPAASDDCMDAYLGVIADAPPRFLLAGESAGGNLGLLTVQRAIADGLRRPEAMALLSPAVDLRTDRALYAPVVDADPALTLARVRDVADVYVRDRDPTDPAVSPVFGEMASLPPTVITTGTRDLFLAMSVRLARRMRRAGVEVDCRVWDGLWHVFEFYDDYPESAESLGEIAAFLNAR